MPPLLVLVAAGAGLFTAYKWIVKQADQASQAAQRAQDDLANSMNGGQTAGVPRDLGALVWDEKSGAYRPKDRA
jgi:hypothetical protein